MAMAGGAMEYFENSVEGKSKLGMVLILHVNKHNRDFAHL